MAWFNRGADPGRIVNPVVAEPPPLTKTPSRHTEVPLPSPGGYTQPPLPPRRSRLSLKARLALVGGAGLFLLGSAGGVAYAMLSGRQSGVAVTPTPVASPQPTPTVDLSYYEHQATATPALSPTQPIIIPSTPVPTPLPLSVIWTATPEPVPTPHIPTFEPTETPVKTPTPAPTVTAMPTPTAQIPGLEKIMSPQQIKASLEEILLLDRPLTDSDVAVWKKAEEVNKSTYYALTGRTFEQDRFVTRIVRRDEKVPNVPARWRKPDGTMGVAGTVAILPPDGVIEIYVLGLPDMYGKTVTLVSLLANETGNAMDTRISIDDPKFMRLMEGEDSKDIFAHWTQLEASKSLYQAAALNYWGELGVKGLKVADTPKNREQIRIGLARAIDQPNGVDNNGWLIGWLYALTNDEAKRELEQNGMLSSKTALKLQDIIFHELLNPDYKHNLQKSLASKETLEFLQAKIAEIAYNRLVPNGSIKDIMPGDISHLFSP